MLEGFLERRLQRVCKMNGVLCIKFLPSQRGLPDRILIKDGKLMFLELKTETGRLSPAQSIQHSRLESQGMWVRTAYGEGDLLAAVEEFLMTESTALHKVLEG